MHKIFKRQSPARIIAFGFGVLILIGSLLLMMPFSVRDGVHLSYIDALFTSTSAVCVTGLVTVDPGNTFTPVGQVVLAMLIQMGGLGVTAIGAGFILAMKHKINLKTYNMVRETMTGESGKGLARFVRDVFITTIAIELVGAVLSFFVFVREFPVPRAIGISLFHSVAAFNNSGFDIFGDFQSLSAYKSNVYLNIVTAALIFLGGIGFLVIKEVVSKRFRWKWLSMHSKVVISVSGFLIVAGMLLLVLTEDISWLGAFFTSVSARTAGFATFSLGKFSNAGLLVVIVLMFIGASPGSTGGGIKTTTMFVFLQGVKAAATNKSEKAFHYSVPHDAFKKAAVITLLALSVVLIATGLVCAFEPHLDFEDILFEIVSAFGTVGLSTGITPGFTLGSKIVIIAVMFIGRLGPLTIASLWFFSKGEHVAYPEGNIAIG